MAKYRMCKGLAFSAESDMKMFREMSKKGWHLSGMAVAGFFYKFEKGEPHDYQYAVNLETEITGEMLEIYKESGWTPVVASIGAQVYRAEPGITPIFSDDSTEVEMLERNRTTCGKAALLFGILLAVAMVLEWRTEQPIMFLPVVLLMLLFVFNFMPFLGFSATISKKKKR